MIRYSCLGGGTVSVDNQPVRIRPLQPGGLFFVTEDAATGQKFIVGQHGASALTVPFGRVRYGTLLQY